MLCFSIPTGIESALIAPISPFISGVTGKLLIPTPMGDPIPTNSRQEPARPTPEIEDAVDFNSRLLDQAPVYDRLINADVQLQLDEQVSKGMVRHQALGPDGKVTNNSIIEFDDGMVKEYAANVIAENMLSQVDSDGVTIQLLESIIDFKRVSHHVKGG